MRLGHPLDPCPRLTSVRAWVTRTSQPEYPSSESSRVKKSLSSARKTPSATNFLLLLTWADILARPGYTVVGESRGNQSLGGQCTVQKRIRLYSARYVPMTRRKFPLRICIPSFPSLFFSELNAFLSHKSPSTRARRGSYGRILGAWTSTNRRCQPLPIAKGFPPTRVFR